MAITAKKLISTIAIASMGLTSALAVPQVKMGTFDAGSGGHYRANPNGELDHVIGNYALGKSTDGTYFGTFCLERNEYFNSGSTYDVALNNGSTLGGYSGAINFKDVISNGTAYLYEQFALGTLNTFNYGTYGSARQLQNTIWFLEGEYAPELGNNNAFIPNYGYGDFLSIAQGITNYDSDYSGSAVQVLNITKTRNGKTYHKQDQLVYTGSSVPDTGATLSMLLFGVTGMAFIRRRVSNRK